MGLVPTENHQRPPLLPPSALSHLRESHNLKSVFGLEHELLEAHNDWNVSPTWVESVLTKLRHRWRSGRYHLQRPLSFTVVVVVEEDHDPSKTTTMAFSQGRPDERRCTRDRQARADTCWRVENGGGSGQSQRQAFSAPITRYIHKSRLQRWQRTDDTEHTDSAPTRQLLFALNLGRMKT